MEEHKAAAYYDELVQKGGGAARFKQGLGFDMQSSDIPSAKTSYSSLGNFVKGGSPGSNITTIEKEIRLANVRDKLKKREEYPTVQQLNQSNGFSLKSRVQQDPAVGLVRLDQDVKEGIEDRGSSRLMKANRITSSERDYKSPKHRNGDSDVQNSRFPAKRRSRSRSPSNQHRGFMDSSSMKESKRKRRHRKSESPGVSSSSTSDRNSGYSSSGRNHHSSHKRRRVSQRTRRKSHSQSCDSGSSLSDKRTNQSMRNGPRSRRSSSSSPDCRTRRKDVISRVRRRSHSRSSDGSSDLVAKGRNRGTRHRPHSLRSHNKSPDRRDSGSSRFKHERMPSRRSTSLSPGPSSSEDRSGSHHKPRQKRCRYSSQSRRSPSPNWVRNEESVTYNDARREHHESKVRTGIQERKSKKDERSKGIAGNGLGEIRGKKSAGPDYSKIIPGFDSMTPGEKVKAKMKLQLSETVVKDSAKGMSGEWERFDFNKEAPLDDDAKLDYFGDGTGACDDTRFLHNTGTTFLSSSNQARREAQVREAHEAAIFGAPMNLSSVGKDIASKKRQHSGLSIERSGSADDVQMPLGKIPPNKNLISEQVLAMQQGSWRERALKLKEQRASSTVT